MRKIAAIATVTGLVTLGLVAAAGSASASQPSEITRSTTSYTSPTNISIPVHTDLTPGTQVQSLCYTPGQYTNGSSTWIRIYKDGNSGFAPRADITNVYGLPHC
jgi:hypothetical protein